MKANQFYNSIDSLTFECTCEGIGTTQWDGLMKNAVRANVYKVNKLVKELLPDLFHALCLDEKPLKDLYWYNPYNYYKTKTHLVLVHSSIEYFLKIN